MRKKYHAVIFTMCRVSNVKTFGAHKIAHELRNHGFDVLVVNHLDHFSLPELLDLLSSTVSDQTLFVGFSNTFMDYVDVTNIVHDPRNLSERFLPGTADYEQQFVDHVKSINANCKIVVGGARTQINWNNKNTDYVVIGYADVSVVSLANHLLHGTPISNRNFRNIYGIHIIDDPVADGFDFNHSTMTWCDDDIVMDQEVLPMEISRGCIFSCKFCNYRLNGKKTVDYLKNPDIIHKELLDNYRNYGVTRYRLLDDTFNDTEEKIDIMSNIVKQLPFQPSFSGYARLDLLASKPHTIPKLIDMGFRGMFFGIETLNKKTGSIIGKGADPEKLIQTIVDIKSQYGDHVSLTGSFICGLPGESKQSIAETMKKLLDRDIPLDLVTFYPLWIGKKSTSAWNSAFNLDLTKFGYTEIQDDFSKLIPVVNWKSEIMTYREAIELTSDFEQKFRQLGNYQNLTFQQTHNDRNFINVYKQRLFQNWVL